jgi:integrase
VRKVSPVRTKRGAEQYERQLREALLDGTFRREEVEKTKPAAVQSVRAFSEEFLRTYAATHNKPSEQDAKKRILSAYLIPSLGDQRLDQVSTRAVEELKAKLISKPLNPKTVNNALLVLRKMLNHAVDVGVIEVQRLPKVKMLKVPKQPFDFLTFDEAQRLCAAAKAESIESYAAILFALDTGARMGEQTALEWSDLDLKAREPFVRISRSDWLGHVTSTKSGNVRTVPLTARLVAALKGCRHLKGTRVFCHPNGTTWTKEVYKRLLPRLLKKAGLRRITWHAQRHTFASHLVMRGASLKAVQELLGHASITTTMRYAHLAPGHLRATVGLLEGHIEGTWTPKRADEGRDTAAVDLNPGDFN